MKVSILVVGGAGYIGSHMIKALLTRGFRVAVLDDLSTGFRDAVSGGTFIAGDVANGALLKKIFEDHAIELVMHFAARSSVRESMANPSVYYRDNVVRTRRLLDAMISCGLRRLVYSSSAAVYGEPGDASPIGEDALKRPLSPYGQSKWLAEQLLERFDHLHGMRSVRLRYFNVAGADPDGHLGERHSPETHLIPLVLQTASRQRPGPLSLYGADGETPDGTCMRDYVHVTDLCAAHLRAVDWLLAGERSASFNVGTGVGTTTAEILHISRAVTGEDIPARTLPRRPGDPTRLVADTARAWSGLGWRPGRNVVDIITDAWRWEQRKHHTPSLAEGG